MMTQLKQRSAQRMTVCKALLASTLFSLCLLPAVLASGEERSLSQTSASVKDDLDQSLSDLAAFRRMVAAEKLPLSRELSDAESKLIKLRREHERLRHESDSSNLDLNNMSTAIRTQHEAERYMLNLLDEYARNLETRIHIVELSRYRDVITEARNALNNGELTPEQALSAQLNLVTTSIRRLNKAVGGQAFSGRGISADGHVQDVTYALFGPVAVFSGKGSVGAGAADQRLGSLEPSLGPFEELEYAEAVKSLVASGSGVLPIDPTLGNARKVAQSEDTLIEHMKKGGPVMIPIVLLAGASLIVALLKWIQLIRVRMPTKRALAPLYDHLASGEFSAAKKMIGKMGGPVGRMLGMGIEHVEEPRELVEEVMFEKMLETRLSLQSFLSFISICAASAPLLGLLGTVTGIINTFKLMTIHGAGDPKVLSSGISEALVTTEFGLIVAIPALLLHAYLSRRARRVVDGMEKSAISFVNRVSLATPERESGVPVQGHA